MGKQVRATERNKIGSIINHHSEADILSEHRRLIHYRRFRMFLNHRRKVRTVTTGTRTAVEPLNAYLCDGGAVNSFVRFLRKKHANERRQRRPTQKIRRSVSVEIIDTNFFFPRGQYGNQRIRAQNRRRH